MEIRKYLRIPEPESGFDKALEQELIAAWRELATMLNNGLLPKGRIGVGSNYAEIDSDGKVVFYGGLAGLPFGEIYTNSGSTATTVPTGASYTKIAQFATNGESLSVTPDAANDKITIDKAGKYMVNFAGSFTTDTNNINVFGTTFLNGTEQSQLHFERRIGTATDHGAVSMNGIIDVTADSLDLDFRCRHDAPGSVDITFTYINLSVLQVGGT